MGHYNSFQSSRVTPQSHYNWYIIRGKISGLENVMKSFIKVAGLLAVILMMAFLVTSCTPWDGPSWSPFRWGFFGIPLSIISLALYFLPTIIAAVRRSTGLVGIILLNVLLGWTFIGWVIALIW